MTEPNAPATVTVYDLVGGTPFFQRLVTAFYRGVATDPVLRPMYPEDDLAPAAERLTLFLVQYWGGPTTYSDQRGHPRLRLRHAPFRVDEDARDRWLEHMEAALRQQGLPPDLHDEMWRYFTMAAFAMQNQPPA